MRIEARLQCLFIQVGQILGWLIFIGTVFSHLNAQADQPEHGFSDNLKQNGRKRISPKNQETLVFADDWLSSIAKHPQWLALLHMRKHLPFNRVLSEVDDPAFFLSPNGKHSPIEELIATLNALQQPPNQDDLDKSPQCRFPARRHWLKHVVPTTIATTFSETACPTFDRVFERIRGNQLTLVFPASQLNSPSSMYGHTLFRLDRPDRHDLLNFSITFAAYADHSDNELVYSVKGLFGGYPGFFSVVPYHQKVKEYSRMESRDVWEYPINLPQQDIDQLIRHAWELNEIRFDYFFFNENCSYRLLTLIDAANAQYNLTNHFRFKAIPLDTVKTFAANNLLKGVKYRPSHTTQIKHMLAHSKPQQIQAAKRWAASETPLSENTTGFLMQARHSKPEDALEKAQTLDLAIAYNRELARHQVVPEPILRARAIDLLSRRSQLNSGNSYPPITPPSVRADQGHPSNRLYFALGQNQTTIAKSDTQRYLDAELRLAYHHLLDPTEGYQAGSTLEMGRFRFRFYDAQGVQLHSASVINIESFTPRNPMMNPWSWRIHTGFDRFLTLRSPMFATVNGGGGVAYPIGTTGLFYTLFSADLRASPLFKRQHGFSVGPELGAVWSQSTYRLQLKYGYFVGVKDKEADRQFGLIQVARTLTPHSQLGLQWRYETSGIYQHGYHEGNLGLSWFF